MELSKQGQAPASMSMGSQSSPSPNIQSTQADYSSMFYPSLPVNWGAQPLLSAGASVPISSYYIVPMNEQSVQGGASRPDTSHLLRAQPLSRVSLRPPQQVLNIQTSFPATVGSQHSPSTTSKKLQQTVVSPKVQILKSVPSQSSSKRSAQKEPPSKVQRPQPQLFEPVRLKFRESLAAALIMDSDQQNEKQSAENMQPGGSAGKKEQVEGDIERDPVTTTSKDASTTESEAVSTVDGKKCDEGVKLSGDLGSNVVTSMSDETKQLKQASSEDEVLTHCMVADELLQGHGLCWASDLDPGVSESRTQPNFKRERTSDIDAGVTESLTEPDTKRTKTAHEDMVDKKDIIQKAENLAFRIEDELFKLFGGVNKKYKEKGRSLLFNLKDKNNPELRERVLSGDIAPVRLCAMTAEELASKELSQWRLAKAEELAQMVVLPDTEVDVRRLLRKTHKGEIQVEVEETDGISVEVELGSNLLSRVPSKAVDDQTKSDDKTSAQGEDKPSDGTSQDEDGGTGNDDLSDNLEYLDSEKSDLMHELMVDDLKDTENLPPIPSLDEFMKGLDSEPPFENLSVDTPQEDTDNCDEPDTTLEPEKLPAPEDKVSASEKFRSGSDLPSSQGNCESKLKSPEHGVDSSMDPVEPQEGDTAIKSSPDKVETKKTSADNDLNPDSILQSKTTSPDVPLIRESIWEGAIQLTLSSLTNVVAIFKSGEKPSMMEWPSLVEIKGRVKLSAFQEFVEQLPKSRSRAIMVTELCWKEGSLESGRQHFLQTIDSYIADERVGVAEPVEGVELYLCPSQGKTAEILARHLPKENMESLAVAGTSIIGIVVWRRLNVSRIPTHHRHEGLKRQSSSRKQQVTGSNSIPISSHPHNSYGTPPGFPNQRHHQEDDVTDDVPPGFGPGVARDDDDLPEFNFVNTPNAAANVTSKAYKGRQHVSTSARPVEQMRELVQKYGKRSSIQVHPWDDDDDDDDIPEWNPNQSVHQQSRQPPLPPAAQPLHPPPVQQMHPYQQQQHQPQHYLANAIQPLPINHQLQMANNHLSQAYLSTQQSVQPVQQLPLVQQHQLQPAQAGQPGWQPNAPGWQPNAWWPPSGAPAPHVVQQPHSGVVPNNGSVQSYVVGSMGALPWRPR